MPRVLSAVAALLLPLGSSAVRVSASDNAASSFNVSAMVDDRGECGKEVAIPSETENLQEYFDGLRVGMGLLDGNGFPSGGSGDPDKCTKKDICLLMRQLDMDFYERAREGTLTDSDYDNPPEAHILHSGNCANQQRGFKMRPIMDLERCSEEARRVQGVRGPARQYMAGQGLPEGCIVYRGKAYVNMVGDSSARAGVAYTHKGRVKTIQICEMDRTLEESGAAYYSPYKLKQSMLGRESHSTSCSFGMYAFLAKLRLTDSHCAKILTYKTSSHFHSAQDALDFADMLESKGLSPQADKVRAYVETIRQKYVLIDTVANHWCPDIWTAAMGSDQGTCAVPRVMAWTEQGIAKAKAEQEAAKASSSSSSGGSRRRRKRRGGRGGRLGARMGDKRWSTTGNQDLLNDLTSIIAALSEEDKRASGLMEHKDKDTKVGSSSKNGKPDKIALTEAACEAFPDVTLSEVLQGVPEAPPDFFENAHVDED
mmetsp:Transcript_4440/g.9635  ORF Transcript_4440/g.9635 Transcript_4440/m.9635 type:complete len:483 (-) Transcript_4440:100-1548(-)|eukprot:CAMPEP_0178433668 /NCGR_PEP_ID=MMETSP0689_2-20121128/33027_1 /TAXON_ID=160604 /ORGANISM="Amphidinium massartii, Strain CS-259" /LENGTH=482 /DNA_ID=CAMNT_0020055709 /DNA_START=75 /DNA_END=1523 /DNA_ORIENTATION=+